MKAINEKEINKYFFKTLLFYLIAALVLLVATFLGVSLYEKEKSKYVDFYNDHKMEKTNNSKSFTLLQDIDDDLSDLPSIVSAGEFGNLKDDIRQKIMEIPMDSTDRMRKLARTNFRQRLSLIVDKKQVEQKNIELNNKMGELQNKFNDLRQEFKDYRSNYE